MRTSAESWQTKGASLERCCSASSAHGTSRTEPQTLGCFFSCHLKIKTYHGIGRCLPDFACSPAAKLRTSADSWQPEGASLESCCSASSAHGTGRTEPQTLGLLSSLATSNFKRSLGMGVPARLPLQPCLERANVCR